MPGTRYMNVAEVADYIGVSKRTVHQMVADGRIPVTRLGDRLLRFDVRAIDRWLEAHTTEAAS